MERKCWKCKETKDIEEFSKDKYDKYGYQKACKECQKLVSLKYNKEHRKYFKKKNAEKYLREKPFNHERYMNRREKFLEERDRWSRSTRGRIYGLLDSARDRARKRKLSFTITLEFLLDLYNKQNGKCALTDIILTFERNRGFTPHNISLDRINSSKGYTKNNVRFVCTAVNLALNNFGDAVFENICRKFIEKKEKENGSQS